MKFVLASNNAKKISEMRRILEKIAPDVELLSLADVGYISDIEENGKTFVENALIKARVPASLGYIGIADDSGLAVDALGGAPGVYSARYAGEGHDDKANKAKLLRELEGVADEDRMAHFVCVIACVFPESYGISPIVCEGRCDGIITREERGDGGFGYDPLFYVPSEGATFAEIPPERKNEISHRGRALRAFAEAIAPLFNDLEEKKST